MSSDELVEVIDLTSSNHAPRYNFFTRSRDEPVPFFDLSNSDADSDVTTEDVQDATPDDNLQYTGGSTLSTLPLNSRSVSSISIGGDRRGSGRVTLREKDTIELDDGHFFHVRALFQSPSEQYHAMGFNLVRNSSITEGPLPKITNEVTIVVDVPDTLSDPDILHHQTVIELPPVIVLRQCLFTNALYSHNTTYRAQHPEVGRAAQAYAREHYLLTCRRVIIRKRATSYKATGVVQNLSEEQCQALGFNAVPAYDLLKEYMASGRLQTRLDPIQRRFRNLRQTGLSVRECHVRLGFSMIMNEVANYLYGDICSGVGGSTLGAEQVGFRPRLLIDKAEHAVETLTENFSSPGLRILWEDIRDFCRNRAKGSFIVDVLHISFPCQAFSAANTIGGPNDEENIDVGYSLGQLLGILQPRIVTMEQVPGILDYDHVQHFHSMIHQFTSSGFSVKSRVLKSSEYGLAQERKRLVILASCPGQTLPAFPEPSHGVGRIPFVTMRDRLATLEPPGVLRSLPAQMKVMIPARGRPYCPDRQMKAITTDGGEDRIHYSGTRLHTLAEFSVLQHWPLGFNWPGRRSDILKGIGNSVASCLARAIFTEVRRHLHETDVKLATHHYETGFTPATRHQTIVDLT